MTRVLALAVLAAAAPALSGCLVVGTAVGVTGAAVGVTGAAVGATAKGVGLAAKGTGKVISAAIPDGEDAAPD